MLRLWLALAMSVVGLAGAQPQPGPQSAQMPIPADGSGISVYLLTIGPGDAVWELFGHNAIWIQDRATGLDAAFNWGTFDFDQPNFVGRFLTGDTRYWVQPFDGPQMVSAYMEANRSIWLQELALTPAQRAGMRDFLLWNARPENMYYRYDYYRDNCSTRVRDAIDRALGGALERTLGGVATNTTYRSHTRRLTTYDPATYAGIQLALGRPSDRPISAWEEAFLPTRLMEHVRTVRVTGDDGVSRPLVASERALFTATRDPEPSRPADHFTIFTVVGVALAVAMLLLARSTSAAAMTTFAVLAGTWTLLAGILGTALILAGTVTRHVYMGHNVNVAIVNPVHLLLFALVVAIFLTRRPERRAARALRAARIAAVVVLLALIGAAAMAIPSLGQRSWDVFAPALALNVGLLGALLRVARRQRRLAEAQ